MDFSLVEQIIVPVDGERRPVMKIADADHGVIWRTTLSIWFDPQGGTVGETFRKVRYECPVGELPSAEQEGMTFIGWADQPTGGVMLSAATPITESTTYYAQWQTPLTAKSSRRRSRKKS